MKKRRGASLQCVLPSNIWGYSDCGLWISSFIKNKSGSRSPLEFLLPMPALQPNLSAIDFLISSTAYQSVPKVYVEPKKANIPNEYKGMWWSFASEFEEGKKKKYGRKRILQIVRKKKKKEKNVTFLSNLFLNTHFWVGKTMVPKKEYKTYSTYLHCL